MLISKRSYLMKSDICDKGDYYILEVELPGCDKKDIKTYVEDGYLVIAAELNKKREEDDGKVIRRERYSGQYQRRFFIGKTVEQKEIKAQFRLGVLKLTIPKKIKEKPVDDTVIDIQ